MAVGKGKSKARRRTMRREEGESRAAASMAVPASGLESALGVAKERKR